MTIPCQKACPGRISNGKRGKQVFYEGEIYSCPRCGTEYEIEVSDDFASDAIASLKPTGKAHAVVTKPVDPERESALAESRAIRQQADARKAVTVRRLKEEGFTVQAIAKEVHMSAETVRQMLIDMGLHTRGAAPKSAGAHRKATA